MKDRFRCWIISRVLHKCDDNYAIVSMSLSKDKTCEQTEINLEFAKTIFIKHGLEWKQRVTHILIDKKISHRGMINWTVRCRGWIIYSMFLKAWSRSAIISLTSSIPIDSRIKFGEVLPAISSPGSGNETVLSVPPKLSAVMIFFKLSVNFFDDPLRRIDITPELLVESLSPQFSDAWKTFSTFEFDFKNFATSTAFDACRSIRSFKVFMLRLTMKQLKGDGMAPFANW